VIQSIPPRKAAGASSALLASRVANSTKTLLPAKPQRCGVGSLRSSIIEDDQNRPACRAEETGFRSTEHASGCVPEGIQGLRIQGRPHPKGEEHPAPGYGVEADLEVQAASAAEAGLNVECRGADLQTPTHLPKTHAGGDAAPQLLPDHHRLLAGHVAELATFFRRSPDVGRYIRVPDDLADYDGRVRTAASFWTWPKTAIAHSMSGHGGSTGGHPDVRISRVVLRAVPFRARVMSPHHTRQG
jgi:hypothetical protein